MTDFLAMPQVDARAAREAAQWLIRLNGHNDQHGQHGQHDQQQRQSGQQQRRGRQAGRPGDEDQQAARPDSATVQAWQAWRAADPVHEAAWQRAELVLRTLGMVPPAIAAPVLGRPAVDRRAATRVLAALIIAGPAALAGYATVRAAPWQDWFANVRTSTGEIRTLMLDDGTSLAVNTGTAVDVAVDATTRLLRLHHGEIHVAAAPDRNNRARPLVVQCASGSVHALGARFCVRANHGVLAPSAQVAALEGAVQLRPARAPLQATVLGAGWQAAMTEHAIAMPAAVRGGVAAWVHGVLLADDTPLADFVAELARYRSGVLRCDPALARLRVSGAFQLRDTDNILQLLQRSLPVRIRQRTRFWVSLEPA